VERLDASTPPQTAQFVSRVPRVLWLTPWYPDASHPYRAAYIRAQFRAAAGQVEAQLLFVDVERGSGWWQSRWITTEPNVFTWEVRSVFWKYLRHAPGFLALWVARQAFRKLSGLNKPDLLHGNIGFPGGVLAQDLARRWRVPYVVTEHWSKAKSWLGHPLFGARLRRAYDGAQCVLAVSEHLAEDLRAKGIKKVIVVPNVVDFSPYAHRAERAESAASTNNPTVWRWLSVASLIPSNAAIKRVEWILDALAWYRSHRPEVAVFWTHVGDGARRPALERMARERGLESCIRWAGPQTPEAIGDLMRTSDLFLHPTTQETFGLVVREALATGLLVVSTKIPANLSWWKPEFGVLTGLNSESFLAGIQSFEDNRTLVRAEVFDRNSFTQEAVGNELRSVYREIV
jgi:glycosyltransferase involved in cell wall biosynthesis